jgi:hypothetical protein
MDSDFLDRLAKQLKANKNAALPPRNSADSRLDEERL